MKLLKATLPTIVLAFVSSLLLLFLLSACTTTQVNQLFEVAETSAEGGGVILLPLIEQPLIEKLPPLPQDEIVIQERIQSGYDQLLHTSSFRAYVEQDASPAISYPLVFNQLTLTLPITVEGVLEFDVTNRIMDDMYIHFTAQGLEGVFISTVTARNEDGTHSRNEEFWYNYGSGWQDEIEYNDARFGLAGMMMLIGSPYDFIELPRGFRFRSHTIGYEELDGRLSEHYTVRGEIVNPDGSVDSTSAESLHFEHIWLDAQSGLPVHYFLDFDNTTIRYEHIERLKIEPPSSAYCLRPRYGPLAAPIEKLILVRAGDVIIP